MDTSSTELAPQTQAEVRNLSLNSREAILKFAMKRVPNSTYDIPVGIFRTDLVPDDATHYTKEQLLQLLDRTFLPFSFEEGFPAIECSVGLPEENGLLPIWHQLDFEPAHLYSAFYGYLQQKVRMIASLRKDAADLINGTPLQELQSAHTLYFWETRAKAFDNYNLARKRHLRQRAALELEDTHLATASSLLDMVLEHINGSDEKRENFLNALSPRIALEYIRTMTQLQRVSTGLPASGPPQSQQDPVGPRIDSIEVHASNVANKTDSLDPDRIRPHTHSSTIDLEVDGETRRAEVLNDPELLQSVQEVVIRIASKGNSNSNV